MRIRLLAVGKGMPPWVHAGFEDYARRMPRQCRVELREIPSVRPVGTHDRTHIEREGERLLRAIPGGSRVVALDPGGESGGTEALADRLQRWLQEGRNLACLIGGADGLSEACRRRADWIWSLSPHILPHGLVRIIVAEQLYRAWSILQRHPYHR